MFVVPLDQKPVIRFYGLNQKLFVVKKFLYPPKRMTIKHTK